MSVVQHVGSGCQSNIKADCLDLFRRPAPAITRVEILYDMDHLFDKLTSRFVSLKNKMIWEVIEQQQHFINFQKSKCPAGLHISPDFPSPFP